MTSALSATRGTPTWQLSARTTWNFIIKSTFSWSIRHSILHSVCFSLSYCAKANVVLINYRCEDRKKVGEWRGDIGAIS
jgi:hypothetical protein